MYFLIHLVLCLRPFLFIIYQYIFYLKNINCMIMQKNNTNKLKNFEKKNIYL